MVAMLLALAARPVLALEVRKAGKITIPPGVGVEPFSTDALVADRLRQDFDAEHRLADRQRGPSPVTLSVTVSEQSLKPGVSLQDLAPGDPDVEALIKEAGETPPPVGDTGSEIDEAALARARAQNRLLPPGATPMQNLMNQIQAHGDLGPQPPDPSEAPPQPPAPGSQGYTGDTQDYMAQGYESSGRRARQQVAAQDFDNVIVARVSISGSSDEMTVVAVTHPGEDLHEAKELVAEEIVNDVLH